MPIILIGRTDFGEKSNFGNTFVHVAIDRRTQCTPINRPLKAYKTTYFRVGLRSLLHFQYNG